MTEELVHVVVINRGLLDSLKTYLHRNDGVKAAEKEFMRKVRELSPTITGEEMDTCLDNGVYDDPYHDVYISYNTPEDIA